MDSSVRFVHPSSLSPCFAWRTLELTDWPTKSGIRVIQENHVVNGCCWLNHSGEWQTKKFVELVREHRCIKAWFSGHFHLGQDYEDSITFPTIPREEGPCTCFRVCIYMNRSMMNLWFGLSLPLSTHVHWSVGRSVGRSVGIPFDCQTSTSNRAL